MKYKKSEAKEWAKETYKGLEGCLMPSFTPDLAELDEEGIRHDVQQSISHGFFSILCCLECGMTTEERKKFLEIVCNEAKGKINVSTSLFVDSFGEIIELLQHFEKVGGDSVLYGLPVTYFPKSEEDIYQITKKLCDSTNLAVNLYPSDKYNFERLHPTKFNPKLLARMADIPNVVGMKVGTGLDLTAFTAESFRLCGDKILVQNPGPNMWPITVPRYGQQWAGAAAYEMFQTPDNPRAVRMFNLLRSGDIDKGMDIYWELTPLNEYVWREMMTYFAGGGYHFTLWKYYQWLVGGNGGMLRQPTRRLYEHDKEAVKAALRATGITPREAPEEEFYVGRVNYAKGARATVKI